MRKYLLEITRGVGQRAERPAESTIESDSTHSKAGNYGSISQDVLKDSYFITQTNDINAETIRLLSIFDYHTYKPLASDGWRLLEYPSSADLTGRSTLQDDGTNYEECHVYYWQESTSGMNTYTGATAYADAQTFIDGLDESDGYLRLGEWQGKTEALDSRPSLWGSMSNVNGTPNFHGRADGDRY